jgi:hypothetical protein
MSYDCYLFHSRFFGEVTISRNEEHPSWWELRIDGKLIRPNYQTADEAAYLASRRDFGDEELERKYARLYVPGELDMWKVRNPSKREMQFYD